MQRRWGGRMQETVLCHGCGDQTVGLLRTDGEYSCRSCLSTFVELVPEQIVIPSFPDLALTAQRILDQPHLQQRRRDIQVGMGTGAGAGAGAGIGMGSEAGAAVPLADPAGAALTGEFEVGRGLRDRDGPPVDLLSSFLGTPSLNGNDLNRASVVSLLHQILVNGLSANALGRGGGGIPPASSSALASLERFPVTSENKDNLGGGGECYISQAPFEVGEMCVCLPCRHVFKEEGILRWLNMHNSCPVCRASVGAPRDNDDDDQVPALVSDSLDGDDDDDEEGEEEENRGPPPLIHRNSSYLVPSSRLASSPHVEVPAAAVPVIGSPLRTVDVLLQSDPQRSHVALENSPLSRNRQAPPSDVDPWAGIPPLLSLDADDPQA